MTSRFLVREKLPLTALLATSSGRPLPGGVRAADLLGVVKSGQLKKAGAGAEATTSEKQARLTRLVLLPLLPVLNASAAQSQALCSCPPL